MCRADARYDGIKKYFYIYTQYALSLNSDQDGDAIKTKHELGGYDANNDGVSDTPLQSYGASPFQKDVFVQADYMEGPPGETWTYIMTPLSVSVAVLSYAQKNLNLHIFIGNEVPFQLNLGNPNLDWENDIDPIKAWSFPASRVPFFHYCLFANEYSYSNSSGISRDIVAQDFIVTLGSLDGEYDLVTSIAWQVGTFLHELGHNLGLHHGGVDDTNYKPNFLSIMNYLFQASGMYESGTGNYWYSDTACNGLDENSLNDYTGVVCPGSAPCHYETVIESYFHHYPYCVNAPLDWNLDGINETSSSVDVNQDGNKGYLAGGNNEYNALIFNGGSIGSASKRSAASKEALYEPPKDQIRPPPADHFIDTSNLKPHDGTQFLETDRNYPEDLPLNHVYVSKNVNFAQHYEGRRSNSKN